MTTTCRVFLEACGGENLSLSLLGRERALFTWPASLPSCSCVRIYVLQQSLQAIQRLCIARVKVLNRLSVEPRHLRFVIIKCAGKTQDAFVRNRLTTRLHTSRCAVCRPKHLMQRTLSRVHDARSLFSRHDDCARAGANDGTRRPKFASSAATPSCP